MARNEYVFLSGKAKWAKLITPDTKYGSQWSVNLYLDDASYKKVLDLKEEKGGTAGVLNIVKKDDDGYSILLKRPTGKLIKGKMVGFAPPVVLERDGTTPLRNAMVGNDSDITCKMEVYTYPKPQGGRGKAMRLESVRVDNLVPYEMKKDFDAGQMDQVEGLAEQPVQPLF